MQDLGRRFGNAKVLKTESKKEADDKNPFKAFSKMPGNLISEQIKVRLQRSAIAEEEKWDVQGWQRRSLAAMDIAQHSS